MNAADRPGTGPGGRMIRFFQSPFFLSLTVGVPFCIYKLLFGVLAIRVGAGGSDDTLLLIGYGVIIWASVDLIMNLVRAGSGITGQETRIEYCTLAQAGRFLRIPSVFLAIDTLLTFSILCTVLWSGWAPKMTQTETWFWYGATTVNLLSLSLVSLWLEILRIRDRPVNRSL